MHPEFEKFLAPAELYAGQSGRFPSTVSYHAGHCPPTQGLLQVYPFSHIVSSLLSVSRIAVKSGRLSTSNCARRALIKRAIALSPLRSHVCSALLRRLSSRVNATPCFGFMAPSVAIDCNGLQSPLQLFFSPRSGSILSGRVLRPRSPLHRMSYLYGRRMHMPSRHPTIALPPIVVEHRFSPCVPVRCPPSL